MAQDNILKIGLAQISPVWLDREKTREKINSYIEKAGTENCDLVVFGEALLPGYPFWIELTDGAKFNSKKQKEIHAHYIRNSIQVEAGEMDLLCDTCRQKN